MTLRDRLPARIDVALTIIVAGALFLYFFTPAILDMRNVGWLLRGTDNGENALGLHAWLADPHRHGFTTGLLNAPDGVTLLFTDSNPLLALIVGPVARAVGGDLQFVGPWYLLCLILQLVFARLLLAPYAPGRLTLWAGVLLMSLLPTLYLRQIHVNLFSHWLILWALWLFVDKRRAEDWRWWLPLLAVAALIHNYLLVMVMAIWGSALLERYETARAASAKANASDRDKGWRRRALVVGSGIVGLVLVGGIMALMIDAGGMMPTGTFGRFGMPIDAPWNPAARMMSGLMPFTDQAPDRQLEASQYLGAGLLVLIVAAPFIAQRTAPVGIVGALHRRLLWLVPALIVLTIIAISNRVDFAGRTLFTIPMSPRMMALVDPVRASGRMFWPVAYVLVLTAVTMAYRVSRERAGRLLVTVVAIQLIDMFGLASYAREQSAGAAVHQKWLRTKDARWDAAAAAARDVTFVPAAATEQLDLYQEVAWRAIDAGRPMRLVYSARTSQATTSRLEREDHDFVAGRLDPDRLYVLLPSAPVPAAGAGRLMLLDGVRVLRPARMKG